jgi:hypothetical protein
MCLSVIVRRLIPIEYQVQSVGKSAMQLGGANSSPNIEQQEEKRRGGDISAFLFSLRQSDQKND